MSTKRCPDCNAIVEFAQCDYRICVNCGWKGDWTALIDDPPIIPFLDCILKEVKRERERQVRLELGGNTSNFDISKTQNDWVVCICAFASCAALKVDCNKVENFRENMIKVAALAVAAIETQDKLNAKV